LTSQAESPTNTQYGVNGVDFSHSAQWGLFLAIGLLAVLTVSPLVWMVSAAFKEPNEIFVPTLLPKSPTLANFRYVFSQPAFLRSVLNTFFVAGTITAVALLFHSMAAFALARLRFPGRDVIFLGIFSTLLVSFPVIIVPSFMLVRQMGMVNSYAGLIVPAIFNAFGIFLLRQFYISIPRELQEAAIIDGASYWQIYWTVILPLSRPILAALAVFLFLANWNSFLWPLTITTDEELWLVQVAIATFHQEYAAQWNYVVAASTVVASPTLILFFLFQQKLIEAIKISALK
jgi:multiple sugar transport system permease protein